MHMTRHCKFRNKFGYELIIKSIEVNFLLACLHKAVRAINTTEF